MKLNGERDLEMDSREQTTEMHSIVNPIANAQSPTFVDENGYEFESNTLKWTNLSVYIMPSKKKIIKNSSGDIASGLWAIMGGSGSGKSTLLNCLSCRMSKNKFGVDGSCIYNGEKYDIKAVRRFAGYVMQDDLIHAELTVDETLMFNSFLRMPEDVSVEQRQARKQYLMELMGIDHVKNVFIGDTMRKGISGGERKRVCIAIELLHEPKILFLDEPTSGLDSSTSLLVMQRLKDISMCKSLHNGRYRRTSIICTIHQPQAKIFRLFDGLILLKAGIEAYYGPIGDVVPYFEKRWHSIHEDENPADFVIEAVNCLEFQEPKYDVIESIKYPKSTLRIEYDCRSFLKQISILIHRNFLQSIRNYKTLLCNVVFTTIFAILTSSSVWYKLPKVGNSLVSLTAIEGSMWFHAASQGITNCIQSVFSFPNERALLMRERAAGSYRISSYFIAKTIVDWCFQIPSTITYAIVVYNMIDVMAATSLAVFVSCTFVTVELSTIVMGVLFEISRMYGGFLIKNVQMRRYSQWRWLESLSYLKWVYLPLVINELTGLELACTEKEISSGKCPVPTGEVAMIMRGYDTYSLSFTIGLLCLFIFVFRILAYIALRKTKN